MIQSEEDQGRISSFTSPGSADPDPCWRQNHPHGAAMCGEVVGTARWRCVRLLGVTLSSHAHDYNDVATRQGNVVVDVVIGMATLWTNVDNDEIICQVMFAQHPPSDRVSWRKWTGPDPSTVDRWWFRISTTIGSTSDVWFNVCRFVGYLIDCFSLVLAG